MNNSHQSALELISAQGQLEEAQQTMNKRSKGRAGTRKRLQTGGILGVAEGKQLILNKEARAREPGQRRIKREAAAAAAITTTTVAAATEIENRGMEELPRPIARPLEVPTEGLA